MPLISVIVPVYKVEAYLQECIDSIFAQTYSNFELILVNDGSPDNCGAICNCAAQKDSRVRVLHQKNQGVTRARANGVAIATGEFVTFVDGDDTLPSHALATLVAPVNDDVDIVLGKLSGYPCPSAGVVALREYRKMCAMMKGIHAGPCAKLFRKTLFNDYVFDLPKELRIGEDAVMNIRLAYRVEGRVYSTASVVYEYRCNETSAFHSYIPNLEMEMLILTYRLESIPSKDIPYYVDCGMYDDIIYRWMHVSCRTKKISEEVKKFHKTLRAIKRQTNVRLGLYSSVLFYSTNTMIRSFMIGLRNIVHRLLK